MARPGISSWRANSVFAPSEELSVGSCISFRSTAALASIIALVSSASASRAGCARGKRLLWTVPDVVRRREGGRFSCSEPRNVLVYRSLNGLRKRLHHISIAISSPLLAVEGKNTSTLSFWLTSSIIKLLDVHLDKFVVV